MTGRHDAHLASLELRHPSEAPAALPFLASAGWGLLEVDPDVLRLRCTGGQFALRSLTVREVPWESAELGAGQQGDAAIAEGTLVCRFPTALVLEPGDVLTLVRSSREGRDDGLAVASPTTGERGHGG